MRPPAPAAPPTPGPPSRGGALRNAGPLGWLPGKDWGIAYLWGIVAVLAFVGLAFVANILVPFAKGAMGRLVLTAGLLLLGWGLALVVPGLGRVPALRPAAAICLPGVPLFVLLLMAAVWDVGPQERLTRLGLATVLAMVVGFLVAPAWHVLGTRRDVVPASLGLFGIAAAGLLLVVAVAGAPLDDRLVQSAWRFALALLFATLLLMATAKLRPASRWLAWGAFAQYAVLQAIDPWAGRDLSTRLNVAALGLVLVLGLLALTIAFIPRKRWLEA